MKKILSYIGVLLLLCTITETYGQNSQPEPRRTAAEQAAFEKTVPVNPAKIPAGSQVDSRMDPALAQPGPTNWKPVATPVDDRGVPEPAKVTHNNVPDHSDAATNRSQPAAPQPQGKTVNPRDINGPRTQPEAPKSGKAVNNRHINGPRTQPEGEKPKR